MDRMNAPSDALNSAIDPDEADCPGFTGGPWFETKTYAPSGTTSTGIRRPSVKYLTPVDEAGGGVDGFAGVVVVVVAVFGTCTTPMVV
jgi:hypothetical protein